MIARRVLLVAMTLLVAGLAAGCSRKPSTEELRAWDAEIRRLQSEQDSLRARAAELVAKDPRILNLPQGEVIVAVPTAFMRQLIDRLFRDVVSNVTLRLSGIKAHVAKKVKKGPFYIGEFTVDVDITKVVGKIKPSQPAIAFGGDSISVMLPLTITVGQGEAMIHFVWDGKRAAGLACGDMDIDQKVSGDVIPANYAVTGAIALATKGRRVVASMRFPETKLRVRVKASKESWDAIQKILDDRRGVCGYVLDKVDVPNLLTNLTETKGFNVRLPVDKIKPIVLPAGIRDSVTIGDKSFALDARTNSLRIDPDAIWFAASVKIENVVAEASSPPQPNRARSPEPNSNRGVSKF